MLTMITYLTYIRSGDIYEMLNILFIAMPLDLIILLISMYFLFKRLTGNVLISVLLSICITIIAFVTIVKILIQDKKER